MARFRLDEKRTEPRPDRRLGIKLEVPDPEKRLRGKLDAYVPPELQYEYKPPSVFVRYKVLTALFVAFLLGLMGLWLAAIRRPAAPTSAKPAASQPAPATKAQKPQDQPVYVEPLPSK
jgi:hypothetical protein